MAYYCRDVDSILFPTYRLLVLFCIPGLLMILFYTAVIRELWLSTKNISILTNETKRCTAQSIVKSESTQTQNSFLDSPSTDQAPPPQPPISTISVSLNNRWDLKPRTRMET